MDETINNLQNLHLDEDTVRKSFSAAQNGSVNDVRRISDNMDLVPPLMVITVVKMFCQHLDVPAFDPEQPLPASMMARRDLALVSLTGIANTTDHSLFHVHWHAARDLLQRYWPQIRNWMEYFYSETTKTHNSLGTCDDTIGHIFSILSGVAMKIMHHKPLFNSVVIKDKLLDLVVKIWLKTADDMAVDASHHLHVLTIVFEGLAAADDKEGKKINEVREMTLREAGGDASVVTKRLLRRLKNPTKITGGNYELVQPTLAIVMFLAVANRNLGAPSMFMDDFLKGDLVSIVTRLFAFASRGLASQRLGIPEESLRAYIAFSLPIIYCFLLSRNGPHWAATLLKLGFLRSVAGLACYPPDTVKSVDTLQLLLKEVIPKFLVHRPVVLAAIKAIKDIASDGTTKLFEHSTLQEEWTFFSDLVLERTIFNAFYERDYAHLDVKKCFNCNKEKKETALYKCSGCKTAVYCSKECQTIAWKEKDHKIRCEVFQRSWHLDGMNPISNEFLHRLAIFDIRRHAPGVMQVIVSNEDMICPKPTDIFFGVFYDRFPVRIAAQPVDKVMNERLEVQPQSHTLLKHVLNITRNSEGVLMIMEVFSYRGGTIPVGAVFTLPTADVFLCATGDGMTYPGNWEISGLTRTQMTNVKDEKLSFMLDEIDQYLLDARKNFRPPEATEEESNSPETIYEYVERKIAAREPPVGWMQ